MPYLGLVLFPTALIVGNGYYSEIVRKNDIFTQRPVVITYTMMSAESVYCLLRKLFYYFLFLLVLGCMQSYVAYGQGKLWGSAGGGLYSAGVLFEYEPGTDTYNKRHDFDGAAGGFGPNGSLAVGPNGKLYGVTAFRGANDKGTIFEFDRSTGTFTTKFHFSGTDGERPLVGMTLGLNGKFYGVTSRGGANGLGVLFEYDPIANTCTPRLHFTNLGGYYPVCQLTLGPTGKLYGMTQVGGSYTDGRGVLFEYDPIADAYKKLFVYSGDINGSIPWASVTFGLDGQLYGSMSNGGVPGYGHLFSFDLATDTYTRVYDFTGFPDGANPFGGRLTRLADGRFYGTTDSGPNGYAGPGIIFRFDPATKTFSKIHTFKQSETTSGIIIDMFSWLEPVDNEKLYGMTTYGGTSLSGTLFVYNLVTQKYTLLKSFNSIEGRSPNSGLLFIAAVDQSISFSDIPNKKFGDPTFELKATTTSGLPVTFESSDPTVATVSGSTVSIIGAGTATITASQGGNGDYKAAPSVVKSLTVEKAAQTIMFAAIVDKTLGSDPFLLSGTSTSGLTLSYSSSNPSVATVSGDRVTIVGVGTTNISASQAGNNQYKPASSVVNTLTVIPSQGDQTITFNPLTPRDFGSEPILLSGEASSGLPVHYSSSTLAVATVLGNTVTIVSAGTTTIVATQPGNNSFFAATPVEQILVVNKAKQTITFDPLAEQLVNSPALTLVGYASSGLPVSYSSSNLNVATISGNILSIVSAGSSVINATQAGNDRYEPADPLSHTLVVTLVTDVEEFWNTRDVAAYPNPVSRTLHIYIEDFKASTLVSVEISDAQGKKVLTITEGPQAKAITVDLIGLKNGIYYFRCFQGTKIKSGNFMKME